MKLLVYKEESAVIERELTQPIFFSDDDAYVAVYPSGKVWAVYCDEVDFGITCYDSEFASLILCENKEITKEEFMQHYDKAMKLLLGIDT